MVPKGWERGDLQSYISIKHGFAFKSEFFSESGDYVLLTPGSFYESGGFRDQGAKTKYYDGEVPDGYLLSKGDMLIAMTEQAEGLLGSSLFVPEDGRYLHNQRLGLVQVKNSEKIYLDFLYLFFNSPNIRKQITEQSTGTKVKHTSPDRLCSVVGLIPSLPEQKKIAKILSVWDKAITTTEQLLANSQQQKKALMQKLFTGKVRFFKKGANKLEVRKGYSKSRLGPLPSDWAVETIKKHLWFQEGPGVRNFQFTESGVKLFNGTNIQFNNITLSNTTTHISEEEAFGAYKHFLVDAGDLLIACSGISVDRFDEKIAFVGEEHLPLCMNTSTMRFKSIDSNVVDIRYFQYFMQSNLFKNQIRRQATGSAQLNFGPSHVAKCFVVLPSFQEQQKIASLLSLFDFEIRAIQKKLDLLKDEKAALMQQLLTGKRRVKIEGTMQ